MFIEHLLYPRHTAACALWPESRVDFPARLSIGDAHQGHLPGSSTNRGCGGEGVSCASSGRVPGLSEPLFPDL